MLDLQDDVRWFGHASFLIYDDKKGRKVYFIDPFELKGKPTEQADIVFITHAHFDHWSPDDLKKVLTKETKVVLVKGCEGVKISNVIKAEPNKSFEINGVNVETIPAYNIKPERSQYHPRSNNWVGYVLEINGSRLYHAGDTDFIPEMRNLKDIDIAMLPMGGTFTMDVDEAVEAANTIRAKVTVPIHYRRLLEGKYREAEERFVSGVKGKVKILKEFS